MQCFYHHLDILGDQAKGLYCERLPYEFLERPAVIVGILSVLYACLKTYLVINERDERRRQELDRQEHAEAYRSQS